MERRSAGEIEKSLIDTCYPYWEAGGEIAKRFFARATRDDHIFYLRAQLWKELHPVDGYFNGLHKELANLVEMFPRVDKDIDRHQFHFSMMQLAQEFNHYVVLADILEYLLGRKITADDTVQLPEEKKLGDLRRGYATSGSAIDRAAVGLTEGGGACLFREGAKLKGGKLAAMTARAMKVIYDDEKDHCRVMAREAAALIKSAKDLRRMKATARDISRQRVAMRNEMFRRPMTELEIEEFIRKKTRV